MVLDILGDIFQNITSDLLGKPILDICDNLLSDERAFKYTVYTLKPKYESLVLPSSFEHVAENIRVHKQDFIDFFRDNPNNVSFSEFVITRVIKRSEGWSINTPNNSLLTSIIDEFYSVYMGYFLSEDPHLTSLYGLAKTQEILQAVKNIELAFDKAFKVTTPNKTVSIDNDVLGFLLSLGIPFNIKEKSENNIDVEIINSSGLLPSIFFVAIYSNLENLFVFDSVNSRLTPGTRYSNVIITSLFKPKVENIKQYANRRSIEYLDWAEFRKTLLSVVERQFFVYGKQSFQILAKSHNVDDVYVYQDAVPAHPGDKMEDKFLSVRIPVDHLVKEFIDSNSDKILFILGGYGIGKTAYCARLGLEYSFGEKDYLPAYIPMHKLDSIEDLNSAIIKADKLIKTVAPSNYKSLIILDGLDELPNAMNMEERKKNMLRMIHLTDFCDKLVVTARTSYFRGLNDFWKLFSRPNDDELWSRVSKFLSPTRSAPLVRAVLMREFDTLQMYSYLDQFGDKINNEDCRNDFFTNLRKNGIEGELRIFSRHPLYLFLLVQSTPWSRNSKGCYADILNVMVEYWLYRDVEKGASRWMLTIRRVFKNLCHHAASQLTRFACWRSKTLVVSTLIFDRSIVA